MEILLLTALSRAPMHGYELKLELQYKHVEWWAKCEHGHLYAALARLEKGKFIREVRRPGGRATQRVFAITAAGKKRVGAALESLGTADDETYFDIDMFLSACHLLDRERVLEILANRRAASAERLADATQLEQEMRPHVPAVGRLIMKHRIAYLTREVEFLDHCADVLRGERAWGAFLGATKIEDFVERTKVPLERG
ncbi:MAG TPA: PadR family transcriptional regulator [Kofleriaceae bacterium]